MSERMNWVVFRRPWIFVFLRHLTANPQVLLFFRSRFVPRARQSAGMGGSQMGTRPGRHVDRGLRKARANQS